MKRMIVFALSFLAVLAAVASAEYLSPGASLEVFATDGTHIGDINVSSTGNVFTYNDDPATSHPPDTSGSWAKGNSGGYGNGQGHTTTFILDGGVYYWEEKDDATGAVLDSGTAIEKNTS